MREYQTRERKYFIDFLPNSIFNNFTKDERSNYSKYRDRHRKYHKSLNEVDDLVRTCVDNGGAVECNQADADANLMWQGCSFGEWGENCESGYVLTINLTTAGTSCGPTTMLTVLRPWKRRDSASTRIWSPRSPSCVPVISHRSRTCR